MEAFIYVSINGYCYTDRLDEEAFSAMKFDSRERWAVMVATMFKYFKTRKVEGRTNPLRKETCCGECPLVRGNQVYGSNDQQEKGCYLRLVCMI